MNYDHSQFEYFSTKDGFSAIVLNPPKQFIWISFGKMAVFHSSKIFITTVIFDTFKAILICNPFQSIVIWDTAKLIVHAKIKCMQHALTMTKFDTD